jgi:hypothetical protein
MIKCTGSDACCGFNNWCGINKYGFGYINYSSCPCIECIVRIMCSDQCRPRIRFVEEQITKALKTGEYRNI